MMLEMKEESKTTNTLEGLSPHLGRLIVKALKGDVTDYMKEKAGLSKDSKIVLPEEFIQANQIPLTRGVVVKLAPDSFGQFFIKKYGQDAVQDVHVGDIVHFIAYQTYKLDPKGDYHILNDDHIVAFERGNV